jgi:hypothetical protein
MAFTTIFILAPFAFFASSIYSYLLFSKIGLYNKIKNTIIKIILLIITYFIVILLFTIILTIIGMVLFIGIIGLPVLLILDIIGVVLLIKKIIKSIKNKTGEYVKK